MAFDYHEIEELIQSLQGTCDTLQGAIEETLGENFTEEDLSPENRKQIDDEIFLCGECNWWCNVLEASGDDTEEEKVCDGCFSIRK